MSEKMYLHLLFFCGILCQGIFATLSDKDTNLSSDILVRKRRVINHLPGGRGGPRIEAANYIVKIKENNRVRCAGTILSHYTVITAALCILFDVSIYKIFSGGVAESQFIVNNVTSKVLHYGSSPHRGYDGIALITVDPPLEFTRKTGSINLYLGPLATGTEVTVTGWGHLYPLQPGTEIRDRLRRITLPIMDHGECVNIYQGHFNVTRKHFCTYCTQQYCARHDAGAPVVINNMLAGIHIFKGEFLGHRNPDVYINLQDPDYRNFIIENALLM